MVQTKSKNLKEKMYSWVLSELQQAEDAGLAFYVDGRPYTTKESEELHMVMEDGYYMKSYIEDDTGKIVQIDFEHIENV